MNLELLKEPFATGDVLWRIGQAGKNRQGIWAKVLAYLDNRCIQDRLDAVVGPENWKNEYAAGPGGGVLCGLSIKIGGEWVTKWDGAENSDIEAVKGGLSDAMKRAAVQWGIGRYLYDLGESWAEVSESRKDGATYANCKIKVDGKEEWVTFYWLPPRLPDFARPTQEPAKAEKPKSPAKQVAEQHGMKTADELQPSASYKRAMAKITEAVKAGDVNAIDGIKVMAADNKDKLIKSEYDGIVNECNLALKKIEASAKEPVAA